MCGPYCVVQTAERNDFVMCGPYCVVQTAERNDFVTVIIIIIIIIIAVSRCMLLFNAVLLRSAVI
jgi:hypothetical protein